MEELPKVTDNYFTERDGVYKVAMELNKCGLIFRETPNADVGIDGQIEMVNEDKQATGRLVAVQIKSGDSHVHDKGDYWAFYPSDKHRLYWESYPIPVILMFYSPSKDIVYFVDARFELSIPKNPNKYIAIPKKNILKKENKKLIFSTVGDVESSFMDIPDVFKEMILNKCSNPTFSISYFDLFINGLTSICRQLFFSMSLACEIGDYNNETEFGMGTGSDEHEFLHNYVKFLVSQNLAKVDYADYLIDWDVRFLQPVFLATVTTRGRQLMDYISSKEAQYIGESLYNLVCERLLRIGSLPSPVTDMVKFERAKNFQRIIKEKEFNL